jgi:hypothetical protein
MNWRPALSALYANMERNPAHPLSTALALADWASLAKSVRISMENSAFRNVLGRRRKERRKPTHQNSSDS